uniref:Secreted protein n=1 Tax=Nelumbo nucifera TaxID=4432 RepID=A0A822ZSL8_NELNU|nr:TPA_asm: hypothetical protein HUJ06_004559 [Nelumbo nucifera]
MAWLTRFLVVVAFLDFGILFSPEAFGSKSDGGYSSKLTITLKILFGLPSSAELSCSRISRDTSLRTCRARCFRPTSHWSGSVVQYRWPPSDTSIHGGHLPLPKDISLGF